MLTEEDDVDGHVSARGTAEAVSICRSGTVYEQYMKGIGVGTDEGAYHSISVERRRQWNVDVEATHGRPMTVSREDTR